jgi:hypothetical protein
MTNRTDKINKYEWQEKYQTNKLRNEQQINTKTENNWIKRKERMHKGN